MRISKVQVRVHVPVTWNQVSRSWLWLFLPCALDILSSEFCFHLEIFSATVRCIHFFTFLDRRSLQACVLFMCGCVSMYHPRQANHSNSHASQSALDPHSDDNLQDMHHTLHDSELICRPLRFSLSVLSLNAWRALKTITVQAGAGKCLACYG